MKGRQSPSVPATQDPNSPAPTTQPPLAKNENYSRGLKSKCRNLQTVTEILGFTGADKNERFYTWLKRTTQVDTFAYFHQGFPRFLEDTIREDRFQPKIFYARASSVMVKRPFQGNSLMPVGGYKTYFMLDLLKKKWDQYDHHLWFCCRLIKGNGWNEWPSTEEEAEAVVHKGLTALFHIHYLLKSKPNSDHAKDFMGVLQKQHPDVYSAIVDPQPIPRESAEPTESTELTESASATTPTASRTSKASTQSTEPEIEEASEEDTRPNKRRRIDCSQTPRNSFPTLNTVNNESQKLAIPAHIQALTTDCKEHDPDVVTGAMQLMMLKGY